MSATGVGVALFLGGGLLLGAALLIVLVRELVEVARDHDWLGLAAMSGLIMFVIGIVVLKETGLIR